ncbi:DUF1878 family protein [Halobacillus yeomjeoni]
MKKENPCAAFIFQLQLLLNIEEMKKYPFKKLVIENGITEEEYHHTMQLLENLDSTYQKEIEDGLLHHETLLIHFAGMLPYKLPVQQTISALEREGYFPDLMKKLKELSEE